MTILGLNSLLNLLFLYVSNCNSLCLKYFILDQFYLYMYIIYALKYFQGKTCHIGIRERPWLWRVDYGEWKREKGKQLGMVGVPLSSLVES